MKNKKGFTPYINFDSLREIKVFFRKPSRSCITGFTFIEILIVLGVIAILATAVVVTVNPTRRFEDARDKQREIHLQAILNAIGQKRATEGSDCPDMPNEMDATTSMPIFETIGTDQYDLFKCLVPIYLDNALYDPDGGSKGNTHYQIWQNPYSKRVTVRYVKDNKEIVSGPKEYWIFNAPIVTTATTTDIAHTSARAGGDVTSDGGAPVLERGVIWGTNIGLTILDSRIVVSSGIGTFEGEITGLTHDTPYYARAYAKNDIGVGYGDEVSFRTLDARPGINTLEANPVTVDQATLRGEITSLGPPGVTYVRTYFKLDGVKIEESESYLWEAEKFSYTQMNLTTDVNYSFQACAENNQYPGERCGGTEPFYTAPSPPVVTTKPAFNIGGYEATSGGIITHDGGKPVTARGICYAEGITPDPQDCRFDDDLVGDQFEITMYSLRPGTKYWVFAFAENEIGRREGEPVEFTTRIVPPIVENIIENVDNYSADLGVRIITNGGSDILEYGVCWDIAPNMPDLPYNCLSKSGGQEGEEFTSKMKNFLVGTEYNVRAYARNKMGMGYDNPEIRNFTPYPPAERPTLDPTKVEGVPGVISADFKGIIKNHGGAAILAHGFCWSQFNITPSPENSPTGDEGGCQYLDNIIIEVTKDEIDYDFTFTTNDLRPGTTYYVRAFAENSQGYGYGEPWRFTTQSCLLPTVITSDKITRISGREVRTGGEIKDDGGDPKTKGGICYTLYSPPPYSANCTTDRVGEGTFTSEMTGLVGGKTYYYRAYAYNVNPKSPAFGSEYSFVAGSENGVACTNGLECKTGNCVDEVCCDSPCVGTCRACNIPNKIGTCTLASSGTDPRNQCDKRWFGCDSSCVRKGYDGYCGDKTGACTVVDIITENIPSGGYVCTGQGELTPVSSSNRCDTVSANDNNCQYTTYYRSCKGDGSCRTDNIDAYPLPTICRIGYATKGAISCTAVTKTNYCQSLTDACNGVCQKRTNYYGCLGSGVTCEATVRATSDIYLTTAGKVCSGGNEVSPGATIKCRATIDCVADACSAPRYYEGCAAGSDSCTVTGRISYTPWLATGGWVVNETTYNKTGASCTQVTPNETYRCDVSSGVCANICQTAVHYRACAGDGNCRGDNTGAYSLMANCSSGTSCSDGSCVSGYCNTCGDCSAGSCTARASGTYASGCSICYGCNGSEIGSCTLAMTTFMGAGTYGCTQTDMSCYNGSCIYKSPPGAVCTANGECSTGYCYRDQDGDRYAAASGTKTCKVTAPLTGTDCYDANANARPGQTSYFTTHRGDWSFDYDCNGDISMSNCSYGAGPCSFSTPRSCYSNYGCCTSGCPVTLVYDYCSSPTGLSASCGENWTGNQCDSWNPNYYFCYSSPPGCAYSQVWTSPACRATNGTCACK